MPRNRVWVLGAGFSKPLGGPLLKDLFSSGLMARLRPELRRLDRDEDVEDFAAITKVYVESQKGGAPWENAEEFLEWLDVAGSSNTSALDAHHIGNARSVVHDLLSRTLKKPGDREARYNATSLAEVARRYLARACDLFIPATETTKALERWQPYYRWAESVTDDTIITFNYDRVPEVVFGQRVKARWNPELDLADTAGAPLVLKMHGSVNWFLDGDEVGHNPDPGSLHEYGVEALIAGPGPGKLNISRERLGPLWANAVGALRDAREIIFIGFSFPPSDAYVRGEFMNAIGNNVTKNLTIRVVLGPDTNHQSVARIVGLLKWVLGHRDPIVGSDTELRARTRTARSPSPTQPMIIAEPMWGQDFLSVMDEKRLNIWDPR